MTESAVTLGVRDVASDVSVIDIAGDVTPAADEALMQTYRRCESARAVVLNFAGLRYMNSGGIGLLVTMLVRAQRNDQILLAYGLSDHYRQIFELTRLDDVIQLHATEQEALAAAGA